MIFVSQEFGNGPAGRTWHTLGWGAGRFTSKMVSLLTCLEVPWPFSVSLSLCLCMSVSLSCSLPPPPIFPPTGCLILCGFSTFLGFLTAWLSHSTRIPYGMTNFTMASVPRNPSGSFRSLWTSFPPHFFNQSKSLKPTQIQSEGKDRLRFSMAVWQCRYREGRTWWWPSWQIRI